MSAQRADGDGPPVVLLHGLYAGASLYEWRKNFDALGEHFDVTAIDWLGFGLSDKPNIRYSDTLYIEMLRDFLREVIGRPCTLVASSLAAAYAVEAARLAPTDATNIRRYARARLIDAALAGEPEKALSEYARSGGAQAEDVVTVGFEAFQALSGFERREAAIGLGGALLRRAPGDAILAFHLDALQGRPLQCAPEEYLAASFDKYAPQFDKHLVETLGYDVPAKMHALLVDLQPRFSRILDLGCGTGLAARYLSSLRGTLTGLDISPGMLAKARQRNCYDRLIQAEGVSYLSECDESYDLIAAFDLVVYIGDLEALFAAAATRLSPGGVFAFSYETQEGAGYRLHHAGRFAHAPSYIDALAAGRFEVEVSALTTLRLEANRPVDGRLALLRRI